MIQFLIVLLIRDTFSMDPVILDLLTPKKEYGDACGYDSCGFVKEGMLNVHIVPHTHAELGMARTFIEHYTGVEPNTVKSDVNMKRILDYVITQLWSNNLRRFAFADFPFFFHWWSQRDQTVRRMVYKLLRQGRLVFIGGGWGMPDEATTSYHAIIDLYTYSLRKLNATFLECGRPLVAWQSDTLGHSREYVSLMAQMGFDAFFFNPMSFDDELFRMQRKALEFLWRGSDDLGADTDIFAHKLFDGYWSPPGFCFSSTCTDPLMVASDTLFKNTEERAELFIKSIEYRQSPSYSTQHVMVMMGQVFGYHDAELWFANIDRLIAPTLETKQDDLYPMAYNHLTYMTGFYTTFPSMKLLAREGNVYLQMAKQLQVLAKLYNNDKKFEEIQWINGVFQDHTVITGQMKERVRKHYIKMLYEGIQKSTLILKQAFNKLRKSPAGTMYYRCEFNVSSCLNTELYALSFITIYNPLAWPVTIPVRIPITSKEFEVTDPYGLKVNATLMRIPYPVFRTQLKSTRDSKFEIVFLARNLPPLGFRSYFIQQTFRERKKRESKKRKIIKKINKKKNKTYIIRQTRVEDDGLLPDLDIEDEDYYFDETTTTEDPHVEKLLGLPVQINYDRLKKLNITDLEDTRRNLKQSQGNKILKLTADGNHTWVPLNSINKTKIQDTTRMADEIKPDEGTRLPNLDPGLEMYPDSHNDDLKYNKTDIDDEFSKLLDETYIPRIKFEKMEPYTNEKKKKVKSEDVPVTDNSKTFNNKWPPSTTVGVLPLESTTTKVKTTTRKTPHKSTTRKRKPIQPNMRFRPTASPSGRESIPKVNEIQFEESSDLFIENQYIRIDLEPTHKRIKSLALSNGININLDIQFYYYASSVEEPWNANNMDLKPPGAWIFRSSGPNPFAILDYLDVQVYKTDIVQEVHSIYSDYASFVLRLYDDRPVVELDWLVGPVPFDDGVGKEVFIRYSTDLDNSAVFYTDANGRQTMKRIRDTRPLYKAMNKDKVAGNMYPVTSKIYIQDESRNIRFSVFNDRSQAGTSLYDGEVDMFLSRTVLTSDYKIDVFQNETENGRPVILRGKHFLYVSKADYKPNKIFEKKFTKEIEMGPQILVSQGNPYGPYSKSNWLKHVNELGFLNRKLPVGIHILTLQEWNHGTLLLRLENYLEKSDVLKSGIKTVFLKNLFRNIVINQISETTLAANIWIKDFTPLSWKKKSKFYKNYNKFYGNGTDEEFDEKDNLKTVENLDVNRGLWLAPQQIRTFVCHFEYTKESK